MKTPKARKLPSGSWFVRVRINGEDISITRATEKEAVAEAVAIKAGLLNAQKQSPNRILLSEAYARYIDARTGSLSPSTLAGYNRLSRNTFQAIMNCPLNKLTNEMIQREISAMARAGKSPKYIRNANGLLSSVLKTYAPDFRLNVYLPQKQKAEPRRIDTDEISAIINAVRDTNVELPVLMALWMGMRMSEIKGAKFSDIKKQRLHICRAVVLDEAGNEVAKPPKTFSGDRWVDIPDYIATLIERQNKDREYIVPDSAQSIYKRFVRATEAAGIEHCRFHDLRHANAAVMVVLGVSSKYAQERNGWSSDRMYKQVYAYTMTDEMQKVTTAIDNYFISQFENGNENDNAL